ncbi:hypothetical protein FB451DRAFT_1307522 [Mycena latifolia]|nr:hypothetical protein FB451DRAFT_1307522 [Mycena latifolia]
MSTRKVHGKRSFTGNHPLLPAMRPAPSAFVPKIPTYSFLKWTFGRGSVIWKIWPAVLLHTLFAACVVYIWVATGKTLEIPNVMLTVMGVLIGFVISYRAISGYDRYWLGRTAWSDVIRNARTMGRLIWYHVPPHLTAGRIQRPPQELAKVMAEKRMALDLVEAFAVALKHHLRGELGIYYEDLYDLVRPLHDFAPATPRPAGPPSVPTPPEAAASGVAPPFKATHAAKRPAASSSSSADLLTSEPTPAPAATSSIAQQTARHSASASTASLHLPLLPASNPAPEDGVLRRVSPDVIPLAGLFASLGGFWRKSEGVKRRDRSSRMRTWSRPIHPQGVTQLEEFEEGEKHSTACSCLLLTSSFRNFNLRIPQTVHPSLPAWLGITVNELAVWCGCTCSSSRCSS